ncbi:MAG: hypothetical protein ACYDDN_11400 [Candidatus Desulforudaceae bacterium]
MQDVHRTAEACPEARQVPDDYHTAGVHQVLHRGRDDHRTVAVCPEARQVPDDYRIAGVCPEARRVPDDYRTAAVCPEARRVPDDCHTVEACRRGRRRVPVGLPDAAGAVPDAAHPDHMVWVAVGAW